MGRDNKFENILNECLEDIVKGGDIESCLARYPEHAAELEPLLRTALAARNAAAVKPDPEFRQRAGYEFQAAIRQLPSKAPRGSFQWSLRWVAPLAVIIVLLVAGSGTVVAAGNSLPDSPLYQVKLATEGVQLAFTPSDLGKAELYSKFADRRVEEIIAMAEKGKVEQVEKVTQRMETQLIAMANVTSLGGEYMADLNYSTLQESAPVLSMTTTTGTTTTNAGTPPVTLTQTPATTTVTTEALPPVAMQREGGARGIGMEKVVDEQSRLIDELIRHNEENLALLLNELEKAPESLKPALEQAIMVVQNGYQENISNLVQNH